MPGSNTSLVNAPVVQVSDARGPGGVRNPLVVARAGLVEVLHDDVHAREVADRRLAVVADRDRRRWRRSPSIAVSVTDELRADALNVAHFGRPSATGRRCPCR